MVVDFQASNHDMLLFTKSPSFFVESEVVGPLSAVQAGPTSQQCCWQLEAESWKLGWPDRLGRLLVAMYIPDTQWLNVYFIIPTWMVNFYGFHVGKYILH